MVPTYVVYVDQVVAGSLVMNLAILWVTAKLGKFPFCGWRLLAAATVGGLYSLVLFVPALEILLGPGYKLLASLIILAAAFAPTRPKKFMLLLGYFYLGTFALGGTVLGIINFLNRSVAGDVVAGVMQAVDTYLWYGILLALLIFWLGGKFVPAALRKRLALPLLRADLDIALLGGRTSMAARLDTGNSLTDPLTGYPVIVVEYGGTRELLPPVLRRAIDEHGLENGTAVLAAAGEGIREGHFRMIPYRSVGRSSGWLIGFRPDEVVVKQQGQMIRTSEVVVALSPGKLYGDSSCRALLPLDLLGTGVAS